MGTTIIFTRNRYENEMLRSQHLFSTRKHRKTAPSLIRKIALSEDEEFTKDPADYYLIKEHWSFDGA